MLFRSYTDVFDEMSEHPWYSHDEDDSFDCTYANIYFKIPDDFNKSYIELMGFEKSKNPEKQWNELFTLLESVKK